MERPIAHQFKTSALKTNITGNIPDWCTYRIPYAEAEQVNIKEGTMVCQYHSHVLFFMEVIEISLHQELEASYSIDDPSLFLFMVLGGRIDFFTSDGKPIANALEGTCYATYNRADEYTYRLKAGLHRLCYLCPLPIWIQKNMVRYPSLEKFMDDMMHSSNLFGHLPSCRMDARIRESLLSLLERGDELGSDLESIQSKYAKELIDAYQVLLNMKYSNRAYSIRCYLDENYADSRLSNPVLADIFNTTEKTLLRDFRNEFSITPHAYLIKVRMERAKVMIDNGIHINIVYTAVGYADLRSFGKQFKTFFGFPPSGYH